MSSATTRGNATARDTAGTQCAACGSTRVTSIGMKLTDGSEVRFTSCHTCEHKSWVQDGTSLPLDTVISKTAKKKK